MIPKECKRLAEVDFPIAVVSKHAAREKSIRHGHPSTLHLWWARRPLAACRAMLLGLLLPDPCDDHCPEDFKVKARGLLPKVMGSVGAKDEDLRRVLLKFIGDFANWDLSAHPAWLEVARGLVKAAHPEETPLVVDPFAGGGSIPLEALRLGCDAFASDLNPVACLILKVMLEDIPRHGPQLAEELRRVGKEIKEKAEKELAEFYPPDPDGATPIAYLWARTVRCEAPGCGAEIPLVRSFWLCKKATRKRALRYSVVRPKNGPPRLQFEAFEPRNDRDVPAGTVSRAKATCPCCAERGQTSVLSPDRVRAQLAAQRGGADVVFERGTGFQPVDSDHGQDAHATGRQPLNDQVNVRQGAYLPHWTKEGAVYAVTFRLADSLPAHVWTGWLRERGEIVKRAEAAGRPLSAHEYRRLHELHSQRVEDYLDARHGQCHLREPAVAQIVRDALLHFDGQRYDLIAWCIMPNHVHVVVRPRPGHELPQILHSWKSFTATQANRLLRRSGPFWQPEYYDHLIRDEEDFVHAVEYLLDNPQKAGLKDWPWVACCGTAFQAVVDGHGQDAHATEAIPARVGGAMLLAVVTLKPGEQGRHYRLPTERDYQAVWKAQQRLKTILEEWERGGKQGVCPVPDEPISLNEIRRISVPIYGMMQWGDLFTARQKLALATLVALASSQCDQTSDALRAAMAMVVDRCADRLSTVCRWHIPGEKVENTFSRQALPFVWDFCEGHPYAGQGTGFDGALDWVARVVEAWPARAGSPCHAQVLPADATQHPLPDETAHVWFTDPPYYDAVPYSHLSDFFFVWLKRVLPEYPMLRQRGEIKDATTPKEREVVVDRPHRLSTSNKDAQFYESGMAAAFAEGRRLLREDGIGSVVFAHKTTEGWESLLSGMIRGGWTITGSWPVATEMGTRLNARETASLATSVHLVCRPRADDAPVGDWADVLRELPRRVGDWMERLQSEGVRGADLVFACIGPALEIFSRYERVETAEGREVPLAEYLEKVWEVVGRTALENVLGSGSGFQPERGATGKMPVPQGALEEDARLTALFLWTLQSTNGQAPSPPAPLPQAGEGEEVDEEAEDDEDTGEDTGEDARATKRPKGLTLIFDVVRRFAQPLGIHLPDWEGRIIETKKGVVRLLPVRERAGQLFGEAGASLAADRIEAQAKRSPQATFEFMAPESAVPTIKGRKKRKPATSDISDDSLRAHRGATTLDRVHAAMLLQASGRAHALRALLKSEIDRGSDFLRLANALSALYPAGSDEKRLLDAMLLAVPR